jgi:hypothetical protein
MKKMMNVESKQELRDIIASQQATIIELHNKIDVLEKAKIPYWAYGLQNKDWIVVNPFNAKWDGMLCVIQNNYPVAVASIGPEDEVIIVRKAKKEANHANT